MAFEEFGSEISDSEAEKILAIGDAIKFIEANLANILDYSRKMVEKISCSFYHLHLE